MTLKRKVYIKGIPDGCSQDTLVKVFSQFGQVERAFPLFNHKNNTSRGFGFVEFSNEETASSLIGKTVLIGGKEVFLSKALERSKGVSKILPRKKSLPKAVKTLKKTQLQRKKSEFLNHILGIPKVKRKSFKR